VLKLNKENVTDVNGKKLFEKQVDTYTFIGNIVMKFKEEDTNENFRKITETL